MMRRSDVRTILGWNHWIWERGLALQKHLQGRTLCRFESFNRICENTIKEERMNWQYVCIYIYLVVKKGWSSYINFNHAIRNQLPHRTHSRTQQISVNSNSLPPNLISNVECLSLRNLHHSVTIQNLWLPKSLNRSLSKIGYKERAFHILLLCLCWNKVLDLTSPMRTPCSLIKPIQDSRY